MWGRAGLFVALALLTAFGCGGTSTPHAASTPAASSGITVTSTIADGARVTGAVRWEATVTTAGGAAVEKVEFLIDGKLRWTEKNPPYVFDDDAGILPTWVLTPGVHRLSVRATTLDGKTAQTLSTVDAAAQAVTTRALVGTYARHVGPADRRRTAPYRLATLGAFGEQSPLGQWRLVVGADGVMVLTDPDGGSSYEPYTASPRGLTLYGPAVWLQKDPEPYLFCEPEHRSDYSVSGSGRTLTIVPRQHVCADRDTVVGGTWTRVG